MRMPHLPASSAAAAVVDDRAALVALYNSTAGADWVQSTGWLSGEPCGARPWSGVQCSSGRVSQIRLVNMDGLRGTLPSSLVSLSSLHELVLYDTALSGTIPADLVQLPSLAQLSMNQNRLSGTLPLVFSTALEMLHLSGNRLSGSIPPELGSLNLTSCALVLNPSTHPGFHTNRTNRFSCPLPALPTACVSWWFGGKDPRLACVAPPAPPAPALPPPLPPPLPSSPCKSHYFSYDLCETPTTPLPVSPPPAAPPSTPAPSPAPPSAPSPSPPPLRPPPLLPQLALAGGAASTLTLLVLIAGAGSIVVVLLLGSWLAARPRARPRVSSSRHVPSSTQGIGMAASTPASPRASRPSQRRRGISSTGAHLEHLLPPSDVPRGRGGGEAAAAPLPLPPRPFDQSTASGALLEWGSRPDSDLAWHHAREVGSGGTGRVYSLPCRGLGTVAAKVLQTITLAEREV